jgi:hypothetical protein
MSEFSKYLTETSKQYDYRIKVAGEVSDDFGTRMETALAKYEIANLSAGKKTPIQEHPLDFPSLKNHEVTIFDLTTNYPASPREIKEYLADYMRISPAMIMVKHPNAPEEEYQADMNAQKSEYKNLLQTIEMGSAGDTKAEDLYGDKANMSLLKELLKDREDRYAMEKGTDNKTQEIQSKEDAPSTSPLTKSTNPKPVR